MSTALINNIHFENWSSTQVAEWLKGLDDVIQQYVNSFLEQDINGRKLLMLTHYDLEKIGVYKLGHQELILEAVDLLQSLRYNYETENLQALSFQLACKARSLYNEIQPKNSENDLNMANMSHSKSKGLSVSILSSVADLIMTLKCIVTWLDRAPFERIYDMKLLRNTVVKLGIDLITACQKDASDAHPEDKILKTCHVLADLCDGLVINNSETLLLQPASLEQTVIRRKQGEELGMRIQSAYYGVHVIGDIKERSPADLCGKVEKGDEVIQVDQKTVVGWQLQRLVDTLKERPKEVYLLLKKRPHHISPFGQLQNKRKDKLRPPQVSTLPKPLKKRRSRDGEPRPSLQEFVSSTPTEDLYVPSEEAASDDKDDGNDTDNDVFRSGSESPQYTLPIVVDPKQRRATVSGGSPTLSRPLLVIDDPDTPTRPKSFTVASVDIPQAEYKDLMGEESNLTRLGNGLKQGNAQQKRQEFKTGKSGPQSLEYTVKKPVPIVQEPARDMTTPITASEEQQKTFQELLDQKKVLDRLEVPSRFQNPNRKVVEDAEEKESETSGRLSSPSSTDTLTDVCVKADNDDLEQSCNTASRNGQDEFENSDVKFCQDSEKLKENSIKIGGEETADTSSIISSSEDENKSSVQGSPAVSLNTWNNDSLGSNDNALDAKMSPPDSSVRMSLMPRTAPRNLQASYVHRKKPHKTMAHSEVAMATRQKNEPQLMKIKKIDSFNQTTKHEAEKKVTFENDTKTEDVVSYKTIVVGGVVQRIPVSSDADSPVVMRPKRKPKRVDRRISCKDLGKGDCEGWLYKKRERGGFLQSHWHKRWCVIKQYNMYYYINVEDLKAEGVLHLPAFQVSPAPEVKTKKFAFKVHNTGASFIFASERQDDMKKWMNKMGLAAISFSPPRVVKQVGQGKSNEYYSESEEDEPPPDPKNSSNDSIDSAASSQHNDTDSGTWETSKSTEDLTTLMRTIEREQLSFDGKDKRKQRTSAIVPPDKKGLDPPTEEIDNLKRKQSLMRTLKAKQQELEELDKILNIQNKKELLKSLKEDFSVS